MVWPEAPTCGTLSGRLVRNGRVEQRAGNVNSQGVNSQLLTADDVATLVRRVGLDHMMDLMIERLRRQFAAHDPAVTDVRTRAGFRYKKPALGLLEWMPVHELGGPIVVKMVGYHPTNPVQRRLPSVLATSAMWDSESGHLVALADATILTALRTAAASAVATDVLTEPKAISVGLVGLGAQAVAQLHAMTRVRDVAGVVGYDTDPVARSSFSSRVAFLGLAVEIVERADLPRLVGESDVLITCTSVDIGQGPVIPNCETRPWLHVNAVGADFPGKIELPIELVQQATVVPDCVEQCLAEGECQVLDLDTVGPDISELVRDEAQHHHRRSERTIFDSTGWAVEDDVALRLAIELAAQHGLGTAVELESIPQDPLDPYEFMTAD